MKPRIEQFLLISSGDAFNNAADNLIRQGWTPVGPVMCNNMPRFDYYQTFQKEIPARLAEDQSK